MSTQLAYIAGLFDGEGCVSCKKRDKRWYIRAEVAMTDKALIYWLHKSLGFGWSGPKRYNNKPRWKPQWRWSCGYRDCLKLAHLLIPYSRVKRNKLQKIINHYDKLPVRHTNDRNVRVYYSVSRHGNHLLNEAK